MRFFDSAPARDTRTPASARAAAGFTLIEVLVVVLIIGVIVTFAALSLGSRTLEDQLETEAKRLQQLISIAGEEAEVQGLDLGWRYTDRGYQFLTLDQEGHWVPWPSGALRARELPQPLYLDLNIEGRTVAPSSPADKEVEPQILILSSGETTAFRLDLHAQDYEPYVRLEGDALGRLKTERIGTQP